MAKANQIDAVEAPPFVLKHRITGAAVLIFFGALVLPWLLGPPSEAVRTIPESSVVTGSSSVSSEQIEDELLAELDSAPEIEEEVYISKITPLDSQNATLSPPSSSPEESSSTTTEANSTDDDSESAKLAEQKAKEKAAKRDAEAKATQQKLAKEKAEQDKRNIEAQATAKRDAGAQSDLAAALAAEAAAIEAAAGANTTTNAPAKAANKPAVEIGWAVQVGLFENKTGAQRVVQDLKAKGFSPSVTIVDTNRGKATGTRVWLGPFAQRVEAAKTMSRLADRTGQAGFIRAYP